MLGEVRIRGDPFLKEGASPNPSTKNFLYINYPTCERMFRAMCHLVSNMPHVLE